MNGKINKDDKIITIYYENHPMKIDYKLEDDTLELKLKAGSDEEVVKAKSKIMSISCPLKSRFDINGH